MEVERLKPYIGTFVFVLTGALLIAFSGKVAVAPSSGVTATSSTLSVLPSYTPKPLELPTVRTNTEVAATPPTPTKVATPPKKTPPVSKTVPASVSGSVTLSAAAVALRSALVNIICYVPADSTLRSISGSGVIIDSKGVILTNAHVAQYFLLADRGVSCTIRTGSPAVDTYKASLMYISPRWINNNSTVITNTSPVGTGQYDFALLAITSSATSAKLPTSFPPVPLNTEAQSVGTPVTIASYGAQYLLPTQIQSSLFPTIVTDTVKDVFTFAIDSVDVFEFGGTAAAQEGSSGGGVVDVRGRLVGLLTTSTVSGATSTHVLHAITAPYIRAEYLDETGQSFDSLLAGSPKATATVFASRIPALEAVITSHL